MQELTTTPEETDRYDLTQLPFWLLHIIGVGAVIAVGFSWKGLAIAIAFYFIRMFGITAGYHRYFAHRGYKTSRWFQFVLALVGTTAMQKGVLWWAAHHRDHHKHSDTEQDIHSPRRGFWWSHVLWIVNRRYDDTKFDRIKDFTSYPEIMWLNKHCYLTPILAWIVMSSIFGIIGGSVFAAVEASAWLLFSTVILWHGTFTINSFTHIWGRKRYESGDDSRNSMFFALLTMGEGWHNNHHYYSSTANQGFFWWEIDVSYYILKMLSWVGIVWDLRTPPAHVLRGERRHHKPGEPTKLIGRPEKEPILPAPAPIAARAAH